MNASCCWPLHQKRIDELFRAGVCDTNFVNSCSNRHLLLLQRLAELIRGDHQLVDLAIAAAQSTIDNAQRPDDERQRELERARESITRSISFILANPGQSDADQAENAKALSERRAERARVEEELASLRSLAVAPPELPTAEQVRRICEDLATAFEAAINSDDRDVIVRIRRIVHAITGGRIIVTQQGERKPMRGWLRGTFTVNLLKPVLDQLNVPSNTSEHSCTVAIDFREPPEYESLAEEIKRLKDTGLRHREIAAEPSKRLSRKVSRDLVRRALKFWYSSRGLIKPDRKSTRARLDREDELPEA